MLFNAGRVLTVVIGASAVALAAADVLAQTPPPPPPATAAGQRGGGGGGGGGQGRGGRGGRAVQAMSMTTTAWEDGGIIPLKYSQAGAEVSPPLAWGEPPEGTASFVLLVYDADEVSGNPLQPLLQWLAWNIPGSKRAMPENFPQGPQQSDGTRQISVTGPNYRGPAAPATGVVHHHVFELFALDTVLTVEPVGASVNATRAAVMAAMAGRVLGKALLVGRFRRP